MGGRGTRLLAALVATQLLAGCLGGGRDLTVYMSPRFVDAMKVYPSLEVDVVGVNPNEVERVRGASVDEYFEYGSGLRDGLEKCTLTFSADSVRPKRLKGDHDVWGVFDAKAADRLFILVNVPGMTAKGGAEDPRKIILPIKAGFFSGGRRFLEVSPSGIVLLGDEPKGYPEPVVVETEGMRERRAAREKAARQEEENAI